MVWVVDSEDLGDFRGEGSCDWLVLCKVQSSWYIASTTRTRPQYRDRASSRKCRKRPATERKALTAEAKLRGLNLDRHDVGCRDGGSRRCAL